MWTFFRNREKIYLGCCFGVCLLLFFLFFLSLGSVCGVDEGIADDVMAVQSMGIPIIQEFAPGEIIGSEGHVTAMKFNGRDNESELTMKADQVVFAIGQAACDTTKDIKAGGKVFTGGDMVNG